ncbi:hypothetical protein [Desmospora activa]|uniref:Tetratricopeptide repeat protein n=1 Tax=Desmospora activa DSM 45169 TaxID=1121389 RepID=A0A2T4ZAI3_9BACL|nr:hypothetical protein [Desmospora activa]PTM58901.1 hypothetical protein C8J48_1500 [Desmospora activa DSM 45169]
MIRKWLQNAIQWFKPAKQKQSSTTVETAADTPSETPKQTEMAHTTPKPEMEPSQEPVVISVAEEVAVSKEQTLATETPEETTPPTSNSSETDIPSQTETPDKDEAAPSADDTATAITPSPENATEQESEKEVPLHTTPSTDETAATSAQQTVEEEEQQAPASADDNSGNEELKTDTDKTHQAAYSIKNGHFHYQDDNFSFSMPIDEEERQVLQETDRKVEEALTQLTEENDKQRKHWEAKRYWSLQLHYRDRAQHYYKQRNQDPDALAQAVSYCEKMIQYAPMAIYVNHMDPQTRELPQHYGYKQLAIIREREGDLNEAIRLCQQALDQEWKGDWSQRIERYRKKLK